MLAASGVLAQPAVARDVLRYGGDRDFAPFESLDTQGRPTGFQIALLKELAQAGGFEVSIRLDAWPAVEADFKAGRLDLLAMVDTRERRAWAEFARGHATPAFAVYHRATQAAPQSLQDIAGQRIAVLEDAAMLETRATLFGGAQGVFLPMATARDALAAVQNGQAGVALLPRAYADAVLDAGAAGRQIKGVVASAFSPRLQTYAFAVAPGNTALRERLEAALTQLDKTGRLEALRVQWLSSHHDVALRGTLESAVARHRTALAAVGGGSVVVMALLFVALRRRAAAVADVAVERQRREEVEAALQRAEQKLARSFTLHPEPMLITDRASGEVRDVNQALCRLVGMPAQDLIDQPLDALARVIDAESLQRLRGRLDVHGMIDAAPLQLRRSDGAMRACLVSSEPLELGGVPRVFTIVRDITEQLARDSALRSGYEAQAASLAEAESASADADAKRRQADAERGEAEDALQSFTAIVSHDLRAPLRAVQGFAGLLRNNLQAGRIEEAVAKTDQIDRAAQRMDGMITALAGLAQVGQVALQRAPVDMAAAMGGAWELIEASNPARRVALQLAALPSANADPKLVDQICQNLLDNAFKYTGSVAQAKVGVDSFTEACRTWFRVADNGAGFNMAYAQRLFRPFQRMHAASQFAGTGVGLSIVRRIVDRHGGRIRVRSQVGVGTVVEFTLDDTSNDPD